jgi:hypothetical protein
MDLDLRGSENFKSVAKHVRTAPVLMLSICGNSFTRPVRVSPRLDTSSPSRAARIKEMSSVTMSGSGALAIDVSLQFTEPEMAAAFAADVRDHLTRRPRTLLAKWLYDDRGCELFYSITQ